MSHIQIYAMYNGILTVQVLRLFDMFHVVRIMCIFFFLFSPYNIYHVVFTYDIFWLKMHYISADCVVTRQMLHLRVLDVVRPQ